jgi:hypothetical protein
MEKYKYNIGDIVYYLFWWKFKKGIITNYHHKESEEEGYNIYDVFIFEKEKIVKLLREYELYSKEEKIEKNFKT